MRTLLFLLVPPSPFRVYRDGLRTAHTCARVCVRVCVRIHTIGNRIRKGSCENVLGTDIITCDVRTHVYFRHIILYTIDFSRRIERVNTVRV